MLLVLRETLGDSSGLTVAKVLPHTCKRKSAAPQNSTLAAGAPMLAACPVAQQYHCRSTRL
jgi:hypothetical protein